MYTNRNYDISLVDHNESHDFYQWADPTYYYNYDNNRGSKTEKYFDITLLGVYEKLSFED